MSHFTKLDKANVTSPEAFVKALAELGFNAKPEYNVDIHDAAGQAMCCDVAVRTHTYDWSGRRVNHIGIQKRKDGRYDLMSDWWSITSKGGLPAGFAEKHGMNVTDAVLRVTTKHAIVDTYRKQGFVAQVKTNADRSISVTLTR